MSNNYGPGISRVLDVADREFQTVIFQQGKPPLDAEFVLASDLATEVTRQAVLRGVPSGWLGNETNLTADYVTNPIWSNWFQFGTQRVGEKKPGMWAVVNGWVVPVTGTRTGTPPGLPNDQSTWNVVALDPPPANAGDFRTDFVFLEVWLARVAPNPSGTNKPNSSSLYRYGNVEGGYNFLADDLVDPALGFETTQRVQLQSRIRVVKGLVALASYPDGFDPSVVKAKGAYDPTHPDTATAYTFQNMRQELGDPGLWRAGDGTVNNLGSVDGYVYAIPLCGVFRRNSIVWSGDPSPNLNGGFNRNPTAVDRTGTKTFSTVPTLAGAMTATSSTVTLVSAANIPLPANPASPVYIQIGNEILQYGLISGTTLSNLSRGVAVAGTIAEAHAAGTPVRVLAGRPDGLYADQVAETDILDMRHVVNPNGFQYDTLLRYNFDKLLKGELRANWKRTGGGTQGTFVAYQDKISATAAALGVTALDGPDGHRMVFSDAATVQPVEVVLAAKDGPAPQQYNVAWGLDLTVNRTSPTPGTTASFEPGTVLRAPVNQLKAGLPGGDSDQIRWCQEGNWRVEIRIDGDNAPLNPATYTVTPALLTPTDDLVITLGPTFPVTDRQLYVRLHILYGAGRGMSRLADAVHSIDLYSPSPAVARRSAQVPANNYRLSTAGMFFWSRYFGPQGNSGPYLPVTAESYVDQGSKTVVLQPFRRIDWPTAFRPQDGTAANFSNTTEVLASVAGSVVGSNVFTDTTQDFNTSLVTAGMALVVTAGTRPGRYTILQVTSPTTLVLDRAVLVTEASIQYRIYRAQGLMPLLRRDGVTPKWTTTDPLGLFSGSTDPNLTTRNMYVSLPAHLVPYGGAVYAPILPQDAPPFAEGVNFMLISGKGSSYANSDRNYVPYPNSTGFSFAAMSTADLNPPHTNPAPYNQAFLYSGNTFAGIRKFTDPSGQGRQGLELPPFYGIARLFGVYEANDYRNGSPYNPTDRTRTGASGSAVNLLRQDSEGPTFWVEVDADGDATFVLNANALDITRSPNPIANFASGAYVIEASIFGFDRDTFSMPTLGAREVRIVMTRYTGALGMRQQAIDQTPATGRATNLNAVIAGPVGVLPGPLPASDTALINFSRTPYGGDAWGTQTSNLDIGHTAGPLQSGQAYQLGSTRVDYQNLSRPNQKTFEVLASMSFSTTAGTGRIGGSSGGPDPSGDPGYEELEQFPPQSPVAPRPNFFTGGLENSGDALYLSRYNGCTERLPLGALRRDKDFRAIFYTGNPGHTLKGGPESVGVFAGLAPSTNLSCTSLVRLADASIEPGTVLVHVDGAPITTSAPYVNFRTNRGGSGFIASGDNPGGAFAPGYVGAATPANPHTNVLAGVAYLVRNTVTTQGATEVSAGGELMLVVATQYQRNIYGFVGPGSRPMSVLFSTNGIGEGDAALDYYRIEGHPLVRDNVQAVIDPATIQMAPPFNR